MKFFEIWQDLPPAVVAGDAGLRRSDWAPGELFMINLIGTEAPEWYVARPAQGEVLWSRTWWKCHGCPIPTTRHGLIQCIGEWGPRIADLLHEDWECQLVVDAKISAGVATLASLPGTSR